MLDILVKLIPENFFRNWYFSETSSTALFWRRTRVGRRVISGCSVRASLGWASAVQYIMVVHHSTSCESWVTVASCLNLELFQSSTIWAAEKNSLVLRKAFTCLWDGTISKLEKNGSNPKLRFHHCVFIMGIFNFLNFPKSPRCSCCYCLCPFRCGYILLKLAVLHMISTAVLLITINCFLLQIQLR